MRLYLLGSLRVDFEGVENAEPRGRKPCALLAMLAVAPRYTRPKDWLIDRLWSDRAAAQASGSFRTALGEIRKAFGENAGAIQFTENAVTLCADQIWVDVDDADHVRAVAAEFGEVPEFLSGLSIPDPEFENWLRDQRRVFETRFETLLETAAPPSVPPVAPQPALVKAPAKASDPQLELISELVTDVICATVADTASVDVFAGGQDGAAPNGAPEHHVAVATKSVALGQLSNLGVNVVQAPDQKVVLSQKRNFHAHNISLDDQDLQHLINEAADAAIRALQDAAPDAADTTSPALLCVYAIEAMFSLQADRLTYADRLLDRAFEIQPNGVFLAWRAYLRTMWLGEHKGHNAEALRDEMDAFIRRAAELEPGNAVVLAISAFVCTAWLDDHGRALDYAERSVAVSPTNPMGLSYLGLVNTHIGNLDEGRRLTHLAARISGPGPYRFQVKQMAAVSSALAGDYDGARRFADDVNRSRSGFLANLRLLSLIYRRENDQDSLEACLSRLSELGEETSDDYLVRRLTKTDHVRQSPLFER